MKNYQHKTLTKPQTMNMLNQNKTLNLFFIYSDDRFPPVRSKCKGHLMTWSRVRAQVMIVK